MPGVHNLAFGALNDNFEIDDQVRLAHMDHSKVFSTIVFECFSFLTENKGKCLGIDGSDTARTYMYYRCIQNNFEYLNSFFDIWGVNYYLRILRDGADDFDAEDFLTISQAIEPGKYIRPNKLYNYFILKLKEVIGKIASFLKIIKFAL